MVLLLVLCVFLPAYIHSQPMGRQVLGGAGAALILIVAALGGASAGWLVGSRAPRLAGLCGAAGSLIAAGGSVLSVRFDSPSFRGLGIFGVMIVGAVVGCGLYHGTLGLRSRRKSRAHRSQREGRARQALETARARLSLYRPLIRTLAESSGCAAEAAWRRFSEGFLRLGRLDDGLRSAFLSDAIFLDFDWKDVDGFQALVARVIDVVPSVQPFAFGAEGLDDPVGSGLPMLAERLHAHGYALLDIGLDSDSYSCFVVRQEFVQGIFASNPPPEVRMRKFSPGEMPKPSP